jgi:hypothetical protein
MARTLLLTAVNEDRLLRLIVDSIVEAATFLDGHAGFAIVQEARVTFTALSTSTWALQGSAECRAAQGTGVSTEFIVAV